MAEVEARASAYGLPPLRWPEGWPGNNLHADRACLVAEEQRALEQFARAALRAAFTRGIDLSDDAAVFEIAQTVGLDAGHVRERIEAPEIKQRLRSNTDEAYTADAVGVPTLRLHWRLFWGDDRLESAAASGLKAPLGEHVSGRFACDRRREMSPRASAGADFTDGGKGCRTGRSPLLLAHWLGCGSSNGSGELGVY